VGEPLRTEDLVESPPPDAPPADEPPSPWLAVALMFGGATMALAGVYREHGALELTACVCLLAAWVLTWPTGKAREDELSGAGVTESDAPRTEATNVESALSRGHTRWLLLLFALLTGALGAWLLTKDG